MTLLWILLWVLSVVALGAMHMAFWSRKLRLHRHADEVHYATTEDGWTLALHRYRSARVRYEEPLILCHGMGANRFNFDLADDRSLARHLAGAGFDVWSLELRSHGLSSRPGWFKPYSWHFDFDDHLERDLPAALALVKARTGRARVFWLGHSMGGLLGASALGGAAAPDLAGLVAISSPFDLGRSRGLKRVRGLARIVSPFGVALFRPLAHFFAPFLGRPPGFAVALFLQPGALRPDMLRRCLANMVENASRALLRQLLTWAKTGRALVASGQRELSETLAATQVPVLLLGAENDLMASPESITPAYEQLGSRDRQLRIFGLDKGDDCDFGHGDILVGDHAAEIVYPEIVDWLTQRASALDQATAGQADTNPPPAA